MKTNLTVILLAIYSFVFSQVPSDLKFDKNLANSENQWVVIPNKNETENKFYFGFLYYDESGGGYSLQQVNDFTIEKGKFLGSSKEKNGFTIVRMENGNLNFSHLSESRINELQLEKMPSFVKSYNFMKDENEKMVKRASSLNGLNRPDLALPMLLSVQKNKSNTEKFYFELAFSYNALGKFDDAVIIIDEAEKKGFLNELLIKEKIFSLANNNKVETADLYLKKHLKDYKSSLYKEEGIGNMIVSYNNSKNYVKAKEWIAIYFREFPENGRYKQKILQVKTDIENVSKSK